MSSAELHIIVFDDQTAAARGGRVETGINVEGISNAQLHALIVLGETTINKLKEFEEMRKTGTSPDQALTGTEGDLAKTAAPDWTEKDGEELAEENAKADDAESRLKPMDLP